MEPLRISNLQSFSRTYVVMSRRMLVLNCTVTVLVKTEGVTSFPGGVVKPRLYKTLERQGTADEITANKTILVNPQTQALLYFSKDL